MEIRKGIDCVGITIVFFCYTQAGRFLMAKRKNTTRDEHGRWDIGAGGLELGESVIDTLYREIHEEYCTLVLDHVFLGYRDMHREHEGQKTHWVALDFAAQIDPRTVKLGEPHKFDEVRWFTLESIPPWDQVHSQFPHFLKLHRSKIERLFRGPP